MPSLKCTPVEVTDELRSRLGLVEKLAGLIDLVNSKEKIIKLPNFWIWTTTPIKVGDVFVSFWIREPATGRIGICIEEEYSYYSKTKRVLTISYPTSKSSDKSIYMEVCAEEVERGADKHALALELLTYLDEAGWALVELIMKLIMKEVDWLELFQISEYIQSRFEKAASGPPELIKEVIDRYGDLIGEYILKAPDPRRFIVMAYAVDALPLIKKFVEQRYGSIDLDKIADWIINDRYLHDVFLALSAVSDNASEVARRLLKALPRYVSSEPPASLSMGEIAETILDAARVLSASVGQLLGDSRALKQVINSTYLASSDGEPEILHRAELDTSWLWAAPHYMEEGFSLIDVAREVFAWQYRVSLTQPSTNANILDYAVTGSHISGHVFNEEVRKELRDLFRAVST